MEKDNFKLEKEKLLEEYEELLIKIAVSSASEQEGSKLLKEIEDLKGNPEYSPNEETTIKFQKTIDKYKKKQSGRKLLIRVKKHLNKAAVVVLIAGILLSISVVTVEAFRVRLLNMIINVSDKYTEIKINDSDKNTPPPENFQITWKDAYVPEYITDGYKINNITHDANIKVIEYRNKDNNLIIFAQMNVDYRLNIDSENAEKIEKVRINDSEGLLIIKKGTIKLVWDNNEYLYSLSSNDRDIEMSEIIKIAESVKLLK